jgi:hypothetical protein
LYYDFLLSVFPSLKLIPIFVKNGIVRTIICLLIVVCFIPLRAQTESTKYRVIDKDSIGNIIFASQKIQVGKDTVKIKDAFVLGEQIWGRAFFPKKFSEYKINKRDSFCLSLLVDDKLIKRITQEPPEADWGQMQVWLSGSDNDYFSDFEEELRSTGPGEHSVMISIGIERYEGTRDVPFSDGTVEKELLYTTLVLSKGKITVIVQ